MNHCPKITCRWCQDTGHTDRVCEEKAAGKPQVIRTASAPVAMGRPMKCTKCNKFGHPASDCYAKLWCAWCRTDEHHHSSCPDLKSHQCNDCGEKGHLAGQCRNQHIIRPVRSPRTSHSDINDYIFVGKH